MIALHYLFEVENTEENKTTKSKSGIFGWLTSKSKRTPKYRYKRIEVNSGSAFGDSSRITKVLTPAAAIAASLYL